MAQTPVYRNALPMQAMLQEYRIEQVLGVGGFGITYRARDTNLDKDVAIKEYLPGELALRTPDGKVVAQATSHEAGYQWGLERFLLEARTLAKFSHRNIVRVLRYFEANATAYMVMDYEKGDPLKTLLQIDPQPSEARLKALIAPLLDGLAAVHATGFLHRDIKPDNIYIRADGSPVLIDFGAARQAMGGETRSLTAILTPGFAPLEQYSGEGKQGPWTDLYAMAGVLYRATVDRNPPDAVTRIRGDSLPTGVASGLAGVRGKYSEPFLRAIEWALTLDEKRRPQNVQQWKDALLVEKTIVVPAKPISREVTRKLPPREVAEPRNWRWPVVIGIAVLAVIAFGSWKKHASRVEAAQAAAANAEAAEAEARKVRTAERTAPAERPAPPAAETSAVHPAPQAASVATITPEQEQRLERETAAEFKAADANGDGFLSPDEVRGRFPFIAREFQRVDANGDGKISLQEFRNVRRLQLEKRLQKRE